MKKYKYIILCIVILGICFVVIPKKKYTNADFGIETFVGYQDKDRDGLYDNEDILINAKNYVAKRPKYKSAYYASGYPDDGYGVCTDVVAFALKDAGYDLMELVYEDRLARQESYANEVIDPNIDFRRARNLNIYFANNAQSLTTDITDIASFQAGDIVVFQNHIGIVSDKRNRKGIPYVIHHANRFQIFYEEDILERRDDLIGHYRMW